MRHNGDRWEFSDLVYASLNPQRLVSVLERDEYGREDLEGLMSEGRTAYQVFTTLYSKMALYRPAVGLWQRTTDAMSLRDWVEGESVMIFGSNATVKEAVNPVYEIIFRMLVEEIDEQPDSETRESWVWLDEIRLCEPVIRSDMLSYFTVKARSKGGIMVLGFQDLEGLKKAIGKELAMELVGQCANQALLRFSSMESAKWASSQVGSRETLESLASYSGQIGFFQRTVNESRVMKEAILPSEFMAFPEPSAATGVRGVFIKAGERPKLRTVPGTAFSPYVVSDRQKAELGIDRRAD